MPDSLWSESDAKDLDALDALVYRSHLLGADRSFVNYGGGNTSIKTPGRDHLGREVEVLWIKGTGFDLATVERDGFAPLRLEEVAASRSREVMSDDEMVDYLALCSLSPLAPTASIETTLHAFLPFPHVDHTHPEAALAFCCGAEGEELTRECFGEDIVWVPYVRPGFALAKLALDALEKQPNAIGMFLAKHGLVTWGDSGRESYERTISVLSMAEDFLDRNLDERTVLGGEAVSPPRDDVRRAVMLEILPVMRGELSRLLGGDRRFILHWDNSPEILRFVGARDAAGIASVGAACPDHVMYTKFKPLFIDGEVSGAVAAGGDVSELVQAIRAGIAEYVDEYRRFFEENTEPGVEMLDPAPRVLLIPGFGIVTAGRDAWTAANIASLYRTAVSVMRRASANGGYTSLSPKEAWNVEYWPLELYKLTFRPPDGELAGQVAVITGGAGAIGQATARRMLNEGAHVLITDLDGERAEKLAGELSAQYPLRVRSVQVDNALEGDTDRMLHETILAFGGVDIVIPNAGLSSAGAIEDTTLDEWDKVHAVLLRGYFLTCRAAFRAMKLQGCGGSIVINGSKNGLAAGKNAIAYTTAKAAEMHMARCLAEEGGVLQIRVNSVAPDAVIRGSALWSKEWKEERARAYGFDVEDIEEFYRKRNVLKRSVTAEDVAEAILFLASARSAKTTGCAITVDGGLAVTYPR